MNCFPATRCAKARRWECSDRAGARRSRSVVMSWKNRSTLFSQDAEVGVRSLV